jgi:predicted 3-demethylubiquinone-9 3-methyltransferase (glyoxalase superfamily)
MERDGTTMSKITPCLWFDGQAEEAAALYTSTFPNSRIERVNRARRVPSKRCSR